MDGKTLTAQVKTNIGIINELEHNISAANETSRTVINKIEHEYREKARAVEDEKDEAIQKEQKSSKAIADVNQKQIEDLYVVISQVKRILEFLKTDTNKTLEFTNEDVKPYRDQSIEDLGYLLDDAYLKIKVFVAQNGKPVNKYSLIAAGKCLWGEPIIKLPISYGLPVNTWRLSLEAILKEGPVAEDLKDWLLTHQTKWLDSITHLYIPVKDEYLDILQNYKVSDFWPLITAKCPTCGFFKTIWDYQDKDRETGIIKCQRCGGRMTEKQESPI